MSQQPPPDEKPASSSQASHRPRDAKATKAEIIATAQSLFLAKGYANTSMAEIAEQAGIAKSLIYHYFGSKEQLWEEVKTFTMRDYVAAQHALFTEGHSLDVVRDSIRTYSRFLRENPQILRLNAWLELEGPQPENPAVQGLIDGAIKLLDGLQQRGELRDDIDSVHLLYAFIASVEFWIANRKRVRQVLERVRGGEENIDWDKEDEQFTLTMLDMILCGARPPKGDGACAD